MVHVEAQQNVIDSTIKATHLFATVGSLTKRGGRVTKATSSMSIAGLTMARVGDVVTYEDGSQAVIIDGAGSAMVSSNRPVALVGSHLSNGDRIAESLQRGRGLSSITASPSRDCSTRLMYRRSASRVTDWLCVAQLRHAGACCANRRARENSVLPWARRERLATLFTIRTAR
jgi:uncharacterized Zn-binding protein involved in type VI secretion